MTERAQSIMNRAEIARLAGHESIDIRHDLMGEEVYDLQQAGYHLEDKRPGDNLSEKKIGVLSNQALLIYFTLKF